MPLKVSLVSADAEVWSGEAIARRRQDRHRRDRLHGRSRAGARRSSPTARCASPRPTASKIIANAQDGFLSMEGDEVTIVAGNAALIS